ncbi:MAG: pentapeptide repeat-containing protein [Pseudolabrys sp.]
MDDRAKLDEGPWPQPEIGANGKPVYDQAYFLKLAKCGRDVWNQWRAAHGVKKEGINWRTPGSGYIRVNFAGVDFAEQSTKPNFSGFDFGHGANFSGANFEHYAKLSARYGDGANFAGASFGSHANFSGASFGADARFSVTSFGRGANLSSTSFGDDVSFFGASFNSGANFSGASFGNEAEFIGLARSDWVEFRRWLLRRPVLRDWPTERTEAFVVWPASATSRPDSWSSVCFAGVRFDGSANFSGRTGGDSVDFTSVRFGQPPTFDDLEGYDLYGAQIGFAGKGLRLLPAIKRRFFQRGWTTDSIVGNRLRHLRKLAEESKNHDLERDLYIEERKAERGIYFGEHSREQNIPRLVAHVAWIGVMFVYWLLADYGRSFLRPFLALIVSIFLFNVAYWISLGPPHPPTFWPRAAAAIQNVIVQPSGPTEFPRAARAFALANAVPFVGALTLDKDVKAVLACRGDTTCETGIKGNQPSVIPPFRLQLLALVQTIVSTLCVFFIALALRNYFRVK